MRETATATYPQISYKPSLMHAQISIYPNPFVHFVSLEITCAHTHCVISLRNNSGKIIKMLTAELSKGANQVFIDDMHSLATGSYFLNVQDPEGTTLYSTKLIKQ